MGRGGFVGNKNAAKTNGSNDPLISNQITIEQAADLMGQAGMLKRLPRARGRESVVHVDHSLIRGFPAGATMGKTKRLIA